MFLSLGALEEYTKMERIVRFPQVLLYNDGYVQYKVIAIFSGLDVSADLTELGRTPIAVVSAGVKSILDIGRTLEFLVSGSK